MTGATSEIDRLRALTFLERIVRAVAASSDAATMMHSIVREATEAAGAQVCSVYIWDPVEQVLTLSATNGLPERSIGRVKLAIGQGITGWVAQNRRPLAVEDVRQDDRFLWIPNVDDELFISILSVPIMLGERLLGVLNVQAREQRSFSPPEIDFVTAIAAHLAGVIEIGGLHRQLALAEALRASEERYKRIAETAWEGILSFDLAGRIVYANRRVCAMLGYDIEELCGHGIDEIGLDATFSQIRPERSAEMERIGDQYDALMRCKDGEEKWVIVSAASVRDHAGSAVEMLVMLTDITERKRAEESLTHQALHDRLTGLPNRTLLEDRLNQALHAASRQSTSLSLLLLDLDGFKEVNDSLGHAGGDVLLSEIGPRLRHILRESDTVARLGGDEFVVLLPSVNLADASIVAEKILATLEQPFVVEGRALYVGGSIGIVAYPEHGRDAETLLRRADSAMYAAKRDRGTYTTYIEGQDEGDAKILLAAALRRAISDAELELHYQPKVNLVTGQVGGVEALVRWHRPEHGLLLPGAFIPIAERSGLIGALGQWTLAAAAGQARQWQDAGISLTVAVNLSARNLRDPKLPDEVIRILEEHGLEPRCLKLEVTESMLMIEVDRTLDALGRLKAAGVQISIDDFGTGYSSLSRLARLPVSEIKIDKSFVLDMLDNPANAVIVRSTIDLAHNLGLTVVAEGVERLDTWQRLTSWGCDEAQGFLIGKPMPNAETEEWLLRWQLHPFPA